MISNSEKIRKCRDGAAANPFQGPDKKVLFLCHMGILRSATASRMYAHKYNTRGAGVWPDALIPLTPLLCQWCDEVVCMNHDVGKELLSNVDWVEALGDTPVKILEIPDHFEHMSPELKEAIEQQYEVLDEAK